MKNTAWFFGDSFTFGDGCEKLQGGEYIKKFPDGILWTTEFARHFNMNEKNMGINGGSNDTILNTLITQMVNIKPNDIVIFGLSFPERFQLINKYTNSFMDYSPHVFFNPSRTDDTYKFDLKDGEYNNKLFELIKQYITEFRIPHGEILQEYSKTQAESLLQILQRNGVTTFIWDIQSNANAFESIDDIINNGDAHWSWDGHHTWAVECIKLIEYKIQLNDLTQQTQKMLENIQSMETKYKVKHFEEWAIPKPKLI